MRKYFLLITAVLAAMLAMSTAASAASVNAAAPAAARPLPVLYNLGDGPNLGTAWNKPEIRPAIFYIFADGSGAVIGMHWARWTPTGAVTSSAIDYSRTGPCCTKADQHYYKVTVTLSDVQLRGAPRPGPYFTRMVIAGGRNFRTLAYAYRVFHGSGLVMGGWVGGAVPVVRRGLPVVHSTLGWNQDLIRPSSLYLDSPVVPRAIDQASSLLGLRWSSWTRGSARAAGRITWEQPDPGAPGGAIGEQAPVTITLSAVAVHDGRQYFSALSFRFTWRGHTYAATTHYSYPCPGTGEGCWE